MVGDRDYRESRNRVLSVRPGHIQIRFRVRERHQLEVSCVMGWDRMTRRKRAAIRERPVGMILKTRRDT